MAARDLRATSGAPQGAPVPDRPTVSVAETTAWLKSGEYLPAFMRDFHDQKDVFKACQEVLDRRNANEGMTGYTRGVSWVAAHVYTVDVFLWMMARHGYTLQRSRKRVPFADLYDWLCGAKARREADMATALGLTPLGNAEARTAAEGAPLPDAEVGPGRNQ